MFPERKLIVYKMKTKYKVCPTDWIFQTYQLCQHSRDILLISRKEKQKMISQQINAKGISEILKTEDRIAVLRYASVNTSFTATDVVASTRKTKGFVSRYLNLLLKAGYITSQGRNYFWVDNAETQSLKRYLNIQLLMSVLKLPEWAKGIGCYGSFVKGTNNTDSDLDLFVFVEKYSYELEIKAAKIERNTEKVIGSETNILILTEDKLMEMQENDQPFYNSLIRTAVTLRGVHIEEY